MLSLHSVILWCALRQKQRRLIGQNNPQSFEINPFKDRSVAETAHHDRASRGRIRRGKRAWKLDYWRCIAFCNRAEFFIHQLWQKTQVQGLA